MPAGQRHILVVDDDPSIRELLGEYLVENNLRVTTATSGAEMQRAFQESVIDRPLTQCHVCAGAVVVMCTR